MVQNFKTVMTPQSPDDDTISTYIIYDYETYGLDVRITGITQLAAVKLDSRFKERVENDFNYEVKAYKDQFIGPIASLKTSFKITPLVDNFGKIANFEVRGRVVGRQKLTETQLAYAWYEYLREDKNTCILGYNNFNFDDKVTSHLFFRNFIHPYQWYYENQNSRVDLFPITVAFSNLCPQAIQWARNEETNFISYKLEDISKANNFLHLNAHDAMSDVKACVQLLQAFNKSQLPAQAQVLAKKENLYEINLSPKNCFKHLVQFRNRFKVIKYLEAKSDSMFVYFDVNAYSKRKLKHATPVACLNNLVNEKIDREFFLVDLTLEHEHFKEFISWEKEELQQFFSLSFKYRKFTNPILTVETNKFPLFASFNECVQNESISEEQFLDNVQANYNYLLSLKPTVLNNFYTNILEVAKSRFESKVPDDSFSQKVYQLPVEEVKEEVEYDLSKMQFKHELRDKFASLDNQITYFPDSLLNKNFYLVNEYKELFQGRYGPNVDRFNNYLTIISRNPILNNLFILFKGNVDFYNLTAELKHEYLNKIEARMELGKETFDNGIVELRRQYIKDKEKFLTEFNLNEIQQISQNTQLYYESLKSLIQEYREQMIASNDEEEIEFVLVEDDEE